MSDLEARNEILNRIRGGRPGGVSLPDVPEFAWKGDPLQDFITKLIGFDGKAVKFGRRDEALTWLQSRPEMDMTGNVVYSSAKGVTGNFGEENLADLRNARKIHTCVTEGLMGVGEMGAIWVTDRSLGHAVCALLARWLFVLLDASSIKGGLHEAYASLNLSANQYGAFFAGPSATADIEAVRITGAQGALGLTALIYNCADAPIPPVLIANPNSDSSRWIRMEEEDD